jgi:hypothetical protein
MIRAGHFEKFLEVIARLSRLVLEIMLDDCDLLLIGAISCLVIIVIASHSDHHPLGSPLLPLFATLGAFPSAFVVGFGW